ncbi:hypothetical protein HPB52_024833 [Rhipicephalus sanguineus]|uniref:Tick transposon n=1 Tax=Rhipicephalus sanguineus TaxID=34632 RepID=A0A9D4YRT6_RHISA|nr:hypothetical protein HPB52_024833 [Rhipicephalus sanguineus]
MQLLRLWAARRRAELAAVRNLTSIEAKIQMRSIAAQARRHERRLDRGRWLDWCASSRTLVTHSLCLAYVSCHGEGPTSARPNGFVWSVHNDLQRQESAFEWCRCIGLTLSTDKTLYMSVANSWGRRRLVNTPIQLILSGRPLTPATQLRILGVVITENGSGKAWIREIKQQVHQVLHLIRRISSKAGGARTKIARLLLRGVLQPRLIYSAQFQHLTARDRARIHQQRSDARRYRGLARRTPIAILQEEAQLNTIDELIYQRRQARELKPSFLPPAADLAAYMGNPVSVSPPSIVSLPPWDHRQLTDKKPISRLRNPVPRPTATFRRHIEEADAALPTGSLVACTDASCTDTQAATSIVVPGHQNLCVNRLYLLRAPVPSVSAELLAIRDATKLVRAASASSSSFTIIRTDSTSATKELRKVYNAHTFAGDIQRITAQMPGQIRIQWIPRTPFLLTYKLTPPPTVSCHVL